MGLERKVKLTNALGLHVRVSVKLVEEARKFKADVTVTHGQETVDAKDILSLLTLGASCGAILTLGAEGDDAEEALDCLEELFLNQFEL